LHLEILVVGAPNLGEDPREDVDGQRDWWADQCPSETTSTVPSTTFIAV
jgi:hypothetical protein